MRAYIDRVPLPAALVRRRIGRVPSAKNDQVTLLGQATGIDSKRKMPMTLVLVMIFNILVALALGFVLGRIYQIRRDELERRDGFTLPPAFRSLDSEAVTYVHGGLCDLSHCTPPIRPALWCNLLHRARRANDHVQDHCVGLRASRCRRHSQDQARYATGATAPRSGDRDNAFATSPGRAGIALSAMNNRRFSPRSLQLSAAILR